MTFVVNDGSAQQQKVPEYLKIYLGQCNKTWRFAKDVDMLDTGEGPLVTRNVNEVLFLPL
jgi:hypothetical protein